MVVLFASAALAASGAAPSGSHDPGTVAVVANVANGDVPAEAVRSTLWQALYTRYGHDALVLDGAGDAAAVLAAHHLSELYVFDVRWEPKDVPVDALRYARADAPIVTVRRERLAGGALVDDGTWTTFGAPAVYAIRDGKGQDWVTLPEVALQEVLANAVEPVDPPAWRELPDTIVVPVEVVADEEWRGYYGAGWEEAVDRRVARASAMLAPAGVSLAVVAHGTFASPDEDRDLAALLADLGKVPSADARALRVAFTRQDAPASPWDDAPEDVGRAWLAGKDVILADEPSVPGADPRWDEAEEAGALAHEVLHALGVPHRPEGDLLMSATRSYAVHALDPASIALARAAAAARFTMWDPAAAATALADAASEWLPDDVDAQLDYVTGNLVAGPGVPAAGTATPDDLPAIGNLALARWYLREAAREPGNTALRRGAKAHTAAALAQQPSPAALELLERLEAAPVDAPAPDAAPSDVWTTAPDGAR